jgi:hypothetical protein
MHSMHPMHSMHSTSRFSEHRIRALASEHCPGEVRSHAHSWKIREVAPMRRARPVAGRAVTYDDGTARKSSSTKSKIKTHRREPRRCRAANRRSAYPARAVTSAARLRAVFIAPATHGARDPRRPRPTAPAPSTIPPAPEAPRLSRNNLERMRYVTSATAYPSVAALPKGRQSRSGFAQEQRQCWSEPGRRPVGLRGVLALPALH